MASGINPGLSYLWAFPFTFGSAFAYNGYMLMIILKLIYVFFLAVFFYLNLWFTGIVSFLRVNFFGI
jgi:hypothetical protein